jgi:hypothetical protein
MEVDARSQGYTFAAALDDTMACRQRKTRPEATEAGVLNQPTRLAQD